ncbi:MAG: DUF2795 domain-containing protein [Acidobacteria bacterium]|nr:MAG: DUF2795 domain-containing protein [Acidobacteriota bacterium]
MPKPTTKVNPIQLQKYLKGINYPATQKDILDTARKNKADDNILDTLGQLPDREYKNPAEISKEIGKS